VVTERLVDEVQVEVIEAEASQRGLERLPGGLLAVGLDKDLGGDEEFVAGYAAAADRPADCFFVLVALGGVEQPVAGVESVEYGLLGVFGRDLEDAVAEHRHLDAVAEADGWDVAAHGGLAFLVD